MKKIIKNLFLGNCDDAIQASKTKSVDAIVYVGQELPRELSHESKIPVVHVPLKDGYNDDLPIHLILGILGHLTLEDKTLLACRGGISRSPTLAVAYLATYHSKKYSIEDEESFTLLDATMLIHKLIPEYQPEPIFLKCVKDVAKSYWSEN